MSTPRIIKYPLILIAALLALLVLAGLAVTLLVDPNQFKPELTAQVKKATSLDLQIDGDLAWQFFPKLAISIGATELHTAKSYDSGTLFAKLGEFDVGVGWRGLLRGALVADRLHIEGLTLRLVTDARGHSNWKDVESTAAKTKTPDPAASASETGIAFELSDLQLDNIVIDLVDLMLESRQNFTVETLQAKQVNIAGRPFPMQSTMKIASSDAQQSRNVALRMRSEVTIDNAREIYALKDIDGQLDNSRFNGALNVSFGKQTSFDGTLAIDKINLDDYIGDDPTSQTTNSGSESSTNEELPLDTLRTLHTKIQLTIGQMIASGAELNNVAVRAQVKNGVLAVEQMHADVFAGTVDLTMRLDSTRQPASLNVQQKMLNVDVAQVLANRSIAVNLKGKTDISSQLQMRGNTVDSWLQSLSGYTELAFNEGFYGDDNIERRVCQAIALVRKQTLNESWVAGTQFQSVDARLDWNNGIGNLSRFKAGLDNIALNGSGALSLRDKSFDLRILATVTGDISGKDPACAINEKYRNIAWPLRCRGTAEDSKCGVDNSNLDKIIVGTVKDKAKQEVQEKIGEKLEEKLGKGVSDALKGLFK